MNKLLNPDGTDHKISSFIKYVSLSGQYYRSSEPELKFDPGSVLDRFFLMNELIHGGHYIDHCRGGFSSFLKSRNARNYMYVMSLGDHRLLKCAEDQAKYAQEMEAIAIHMLTITYDIDGDTTAVECRKMSPMKYKSVRSIRKYNNTSARILMLKDFDNLFYTIFTDINNRDEPARFQIRLTTLLNPSLQHLHNKVFKFDISKSLRDIVNLSETNTVGPQHRNHTQDTSKTP
eukprot:gene9393-16516_t